MIFEIFRGESKTMVIARLKVYEGRDSLNELEALLTPFDLLRSAKRCILALILLCLPEEHLDSVLPDSYDFLRDSLCTLSVRLYLGLGTEVFSLAQHHIDLR